MLQTGTTPDDRDGRGRGFTVTPQPRRLEPVVHDPFADGLGPVRVAPPAGVQPAVRPAA